MTEEVDRVSIGDVFAVVFVSHSQAFGPTRTKEEWISHSPSHFYMTYKFASADPTNWNQRQVIGLDEYGLCKTCWDHQLSDMKRYQEFVREVMQRGEFLSAIDVFAGTGAFGHAIASASGCMKVDYAVENDPDAAQTIKCVCFSTLR